MAEIILDDTKIAVPKRLNITTFLSELQKKTKQFLYLVDKKEVGIFQNLNEVKKGMWRKMKIQDDVCHHYIDPDTEIEYIVFSDELVKKLGSFPYEGPSIAKRQQQQVQMSQATIPSFAPSSLPHQVSQPSFVVHSSQNLQPPITSDFSFYQQNPNHHYQQVNQYPNYSTLPTNNNYNPQNLIQSSQQVPQNPMMAQQQMNPLPQMNQQPQQTSYPSYPSLNEIPRYNNLDLNETFQQFANLIQSNTTNYSQPFNNQQTSNQSKQNNNGNNNSNSQQPKLSSKSLQNLNRIQAFLKQQINPQGQQQNQSVQNGMQQPPDELFQQQGFSSWNLNQQSQQPQQQPLFQRVNQDQQFMNLNQGQQQGQGLQGQMQNLQRQTLPVQQQQLGQQQPLTTNPRQVSIQSVQQPVISSRVQPVRKSTIPVQLPSAQTLQTIQTESIPGQGSANGRQKYFPPYQGKKKVNPTQPSQQPNQNIAPQPVENKFSA